MKGVSMIRVTFRPEAKCDGCTWTAGGYIGMPAAAVRSDAQHHVKDTGHTVLVDVIDRTSYAPEVTP